MRVTKETREKTRQRILEAARARFEQVGYASATTREIAAEAGIAAGTLFNYFGSKEALAAALLVEATGAAEAEFDRSRREDESLEEALFAYVAIQLRYLLPHRPWVAEVLEAGASPLRARDDDDQAGFRLRHLERVERWLAARGHEETLLTLHLYWTLYLGVLDFWARDESHHQEASLALLDRSVGLFCRGLEEQSMPGE